MGAQNNQHRFTRFSDLCHILRMSKPTPLPETLVQKLKALSVGEDRLFEGHEPNSVRVTITRLKNAPGSKRDYITRLEDGVARVWRLKDRKPK